MNTRISKSHRKDSKSSNPLSPTDKQRSDAAMQEFVAVEEFVEELVTKASNSRESLARLLQVAYETTKALQVICQQSPDRLEYLGGRLKEWPLLTSRRNQKRNLELLENIGLSNSLRTPVDFQKFSRTSTTARRWAIRAIEGIESQRLASKWQSAESFEQLSERLFLNPAFFLNDINAARLSEPFQQPLLRNIETECYGSSEEMRSRVAHRDAFYKDFEKACTALPDLKVSTVTRWMPVVRMLILFLTHGHPEYNLSLRKIGCYRKKHYESKPGPKKQKPKFLLSSESNVRDGIFSKLSTAIAAIAEKG